MGIKAVLFDMDGVIIDSEPEYCRVEIALFKKLGLQLDEKDQKVYVGINPKVMWREIKYRFNLSQTEQELYDMEATQIREYYANGSLLPNQNILDLLDRLYSSREWLCGLVTSSDRENMHQVIMRLNLSRYFQVTITNDDVKRCKPYPDIYLLAAQRLCVLPNECIAIEDSKSGVESAKAAGMKVIHYCNDKSKALSNADLTVSSVNIDMLENMFSSNSETCL